MAENEQINVEETVAETSAPKAKKVTFLRKEMIKEKEHLEKKLANLIRQSFLLDAFKSCKGGRTLRFSALVVVGDRKGRVGIGLGKSKEVSAAIEKATTAAKKNVVNIPIVNDTIPHEVIGKFSATSIILLPAPEGTGVIAGGSARAVIELAGIKNIVTKRHGSSNRMNCVKATMQGLTSLKTKEEIARRRGKAVEEI